jgi:hypothetical protein
VLAVLFRSCSLEIRENDRQSELSRNFSTEMVPQARHGLSRDLSQIPALSQKTREGKALAMGAFFYDTLFAGFAGFIAFSPSRSS